MKRIPKVKVVAMTGRAAMPSVPSLEKLGEVFRVVEPNGSPAGSARYPSDGGGFADRRAAEALAVTINQRRARRTAA